MGAWSPVIWLFFGGVAVGMANVYIFLYLPLAQQLSERTKSKPVLKVTRQYYKR